MGQEGRVNRHHLPPPVTAAGPTLQPTTFTATTGGATDEAATTTASYPVCAELPPPAIDVLQPSAVTPSSSRSSFIRLAASHLRSPPPLTSTAPCSPPTIGVLLVVRGEL
ncbi:hypothetical protein OsI_30536 [Oryza sativa Indica Group]|uniref:Uncharacterized protein n=1 Tax=Oryza sativa subsp. indica TaxID=39946 RepID=A2YYX3_ORYSI|nr:hypothetical protein OsI_30536 [Oryza sativa Indica Group]